jgi:hypothetical protein
MDYLIIQLIVIMLVCGFVYWIWTLARPLLPIAGPFAQVVDILVLVLIGFIVLFYAIIPLLKMLPRLLH